MRPAGLINIITSHLLTESEVITGKSQTEALMYWYIKSEVWDFPVMTEWTRLISYLLYGLFSAFLKKNTIRTPEVIFHIRLRAPWLSSSLILKCFCMLVFLSVIEDIVVPPFDRLFCCFRPRARGFYSQLKRAREKFHNARSLQENNAHSAANQSGHTIVAI